MNDYNPTINEIDEALREARCPRCSHDFGLHAVDALRECMGNGDHCTCFVSQRTLRADADRAWKRA